MKPLALAAALALCASAAHAQSEFAFSYLGTTTHFRNDWECPGSICAPGSSTVTVAPWSGTFAIFTDASADGVYGDEHLRISLDGALLNILADQPIMGGGLHATLAGGTLIDLSGAFLRFAPESFRTDGSAFSWNLPAQHHYGQTFGDATLLRVSHAPEPGTLLLVALGLGAIVGRKKWSTGG